MTTWCEPFRETEMLPELEREEMLDDRLSREDERERRPTIVEILELDSSC